MTRIVEVPLSTTPFPISKETEATTATATRARERKISHLERPRRQGVPRNLKCDDVSRLPLGLDHAPPQPTKSAVKSTGKIW
eukprot:scaffold4358_cov177-Ochromonas_danica.AAC.29